MLRPAEDLLSKSLQALGTVPLAGDPEERSAKQVPRAEDVLRFKATRTDSIGRPPSVVKRNL